MHQQQLDIDQPTAVRVTVAATTVGWIVSEPGGWLAAYTADGRRIVGCGHSKGEAVRHVLQSIRPHLGRPEPLPAAIARQVIGSEATQ